MTDGVGDRLKANVIWFASGLVATVVIGTIGGVAWLDNHIEERIRHSEYLKNEIREVGVQLPAGAVVAFDLSTGCPRPAWVEVEDYSGRVIVGAGQGRDLTPRNFRVADGRERRTLDRSVLPKERLGFQVVQVDGYVRSDTSRGGAISGIGHDLPAGSVSRHTDFLGDGNALEMMPPFLPLYLCRKK